MFRITDRKDKSMRQAAIALLIVLLLCQAIFSAQPLTENDLQFGPFKIFGTFDIEAAKKHFGTPDITDLAKGYKAVYFADAEFITDGENKISQLTIYSAPPGFSTPRGLKIGDRAQKITELYGKPNSKKPSPFDKNIYILSYTISSGSLNITTEKEKITVITLDRFKRSI